MKEYRIDKDKIDMLMIKAKIPNYGKLAAAAGIHPNTLTRILQGGTWTSETARKLANALNCNPMDFQVTDGYPDPKWAAQAVPSISTI